MLFNLSTFSPILFFLSIVWWIQRGSDGLGIGNGRFNITLKMIVVSIVGIIGFLFAFYSVVIVKVSCSKLGITPISVNAVNSKDKSSIIAIISYIFPFSNLILKDYNIWISLSIIVIAVLIALLSNTVFPNPVLSFWGYHFYEITNDNGSEELPLISKRKSIQDAKTIKQVVAIWDYFMIEVKQ